MTDTIKKIIKEEEGRLYYQYLEGHEREECCEEDTHPSPGWCAGSVAPVGEICRELAATHVVVDMDCPVCQENWQVFRVRLGVPGEPTQTIDITFQEAVDLLWG